MEITIVTSAQQLFNQGRRESPQSQNKEDMKMSERKKWVIWSGEGEVGTKEVKLATEIGIKRILTAER